MFDVSTYDVSEIEVVSLIDFSVYQSKMNKLLKGLAFRLTKIAFQFVVRNHLIRNQVLIIN